MKQMSSKFQSHVWIVVISLLWIMAAGCGTTPIVPFSGTVPQTAIDVDGTYAMAFTDPGADTSTFPPNPTLEIAGGLFTRWGNRSMTPTDVQVKGSNYIWSSAADVVFPTVPGPVTTTVTLNVNLQPDNSLVGTMVLIINGQPTDPSGLKLTKQ